MIVLTFDISTANIGFAYKINLQQWNSNVVSFKPKDTDFIKIQKLKVVLSELKLLFKDETISILVETPKAIFKGYQAFARQKEFLGIIKTLCFLTFEKIVSWKEIQSTQWQSLYDFKTIKKDLNMDYKAISIKFANEVGSTHLVIDDNEADAINMLMKYDEIINKLNAF